uniref:Ycf2 N-terminal domain-containing protein n=1 Tax=Helianthus annuus TaxID=4232 RepID=A0A1Y3BTY7_HELAN
MNLSDSEGKNLYQYLNFNSNMGLIHTPCSENIYHPKEEKRSLCLKKCVEKGQMYRTFQRDSAYSTLSNGIYSNIYAMVPYFDRVQISKFLFLDTFSDLLPILSSSQNLYPFFMILCMDQIYHGEFFRKILSSTMDLIVRFR